MIPKIADHLVLGGLTMNTSNQYAASFDQWVRFTENMNADGVEQFPVLLTGENPPETSGICSRSSRTRAGSWATSQPP